MVDVGQPSLPPQVLTGLWTADDRRLGLGYEDQTVQIYGIVEFLALVIRWPLLSLLFKVSFLYISGEEIAQIMVHRLSCFMTKRTQTCHVEGNLEILSKNYHVSSFLYLETKQQTASMSFSWIVVFLQFIYPCRTTGRWSRGRVAMFFCWFPKPQGEISPLSSEQIWVVWVALGDEIAHNMGIPI